MNIKCTVCGDGAVGKTSMILSYTTNKFPVDHIPTVFDNYDTKVKYEGKIYTLGLWDTAGQDDGFEKVRQLTYPGTDIALVCFSIDSLSSFNNVKTKWVPELSHYAPGVPIILVGTKMDLRDRVNSNGQMIATHQGQTLKNELGLAAYFETSALTQTNLKILFEEALKRASALKPAPIKKKKGGCEIL